MVPRANWKGYLKVDELVCPVALYTAASTSERIAFHMVNRSTGHRLQRQFVDSETGRPVEREDQVKGYAVGDNDYIVLDSEEVAAAVPESDKTMAVSAFLDCAAIDTLYFDKPYYLAPADRSAEEAYALIRDGMKSESVAALAQTVLFRRVRTLLIRPSGEGLVATTLNYDYEVRSADEVFAGIPEIRLQDEMLELAEHIIGKKSGRFDPAGFDDRYEAALAEVVRAKIEGRKIRRARPKAEGKVVDLMAALRESAGVAEKPGKRRARPAGGRRKAG